MAKAFPLLTVAVDGDISDNAPCMIHTRLSELSHFSQTIHDPNRVKELHAMRIAAKRLRYTLEIFQPFVEQTPLKSAMALALSETKKIQEYVGEIHDRDVRLPLITSFQARRERKNPEMKSGLTRLAVEECEDRDRIYTEFIGHWNRIGAGYTNRMMTLIRDISVNKPEPAKLELTDSKPAEPDAKPRVARAGRRTKQS